MATIKGKKGLSVNVQHDYLTLKTPVGNYTSSRNGAKCSGQLVSMPGAFEAIDRYVETEVKKPGMSYGKVFDELIKPEVMDRLVPGWDKPKVVDIAAGDTVKFSGAFGKKYPGEHKIEKVERKYAYIKMPQKGGTMSNVGFPIFEMEKINSLKKV